MLHSHTVDAATGDISFIVVRGDVFQHCDLERKMAIINLFNFKKKHKSRFTITRVHNICMSAVQGSYLASEVAHCFVFTD